MADVLVQVVLEQLFSIILEEAEQEVRLVVGVENEVKKLTSNLQAIKAVLEDAEKRQLKEATVRDWVDKLKDASYDVDDVLEEWSTAILKSKIEKDGREVESTPSLKLKLSSFIPSSCFFVGRVALRRDIALKIKELNKRLDLIAKEKDMYNFNLVSATSFPERQMTASVIDVSEVHGRDQDKNKLVNMLLSESSQEGRAVHIISVVGMGGIGKTTLAQLAYNSSKVKAHFEKMIWVCVSDPFDEIRIGKAILEGLTGAAPNLVELETLLQHIQQSIEGRKFLLVLDDVWTEDPRKWEKLKHSLIRGSPGSKILVTTRKEKVANVMGCTSIFTLGKLSREKCWSLFSQVAFFERTMEEREYLEDIGLKIIDKCKGLPLAAKTLGGLMRFKRNREEWQVVLDSEIWELEEAETDLFPPLFLSYYDLSPELRQCFLYCAIFPKDYVIDRDILIKLWMAQGYLCSRGSTEMEIVGQKYFEHLSMRSFFQDFVKDKDDGSIKCKMHDIVHDFAQFLTKNECLVIEVNGTKEVMVNSFCRKTRHSTMMLASGASFADPIYNAENLRSLLVKSKDPSSISAALTDVFCRLTRLRALDLSKCPFEEVPCGVEKLIHLRYLNLSYNRHLEELPEAVCDLCNLQTLDLTGCERLVKLPHGMGKLVNLRHLENSRTSSLSFMPKGIERLTSLRTVRVFVLSGGGNDGGAATLGCLKDLNNLRGHLNIKGLGNVADADEAKEANLKDKKHLLSLSLNFCGKKAEEKMNADEVIEALQPPSNLEDLNIFKFRGNSVFPSWMMSLTKLRKVKFSECINCEHLPPLGKLLSLESLTIANMRSVKRVGKELLGVETDDSVNHGTPVVAFPNLKKLKFLYMKEWEEWNYGITRRGEEDVTTIMPSLRSLTISSCPKLKALEDQLQTIPLEKLFIYKCPILKERYRKGTGEDWLKISHIPYIENDSKNLQQSHRPSLRFRTLKMPSSHC